MWVCLPECAKYEDISVLCNFPPDSIHGEKGSYYLDGKVVIPRNIDQSFSQLAQCLLSESIY